MNLYGKHLRVPLTRSLQLLPRGASLRRWPLTRIVAIVGAREAALIVAAKAGRIASVAVVDRQLVVGSRSSRTDREVPEG